MSQYRLRKNEIHKLYSKEQEQRFLKLLKKEKYIQDQEQNLDEADYINIMNEMCHLELSVRLDKDYNEPDFIIEQHENLDCVVDSVLYPYVESHEEYKIQQKLTQRIKSV